MIDQLVLRPPDDWHVHLRQGELLSEVLPFTTRCFRRAMVMPNTIPPITDKYRGQIYLAEIGQLVQQQASNFQPLLSCYLTDSTSPVGLVDAFVAKIFQAAKWYPVNTTTHSNDGVRDYRQLFDLFDCMQRHQIPLLIHGEVSNSEIDIFDREIIFIEQVLIEILKRFPDLSIVLEHISTAEAVHFIREYSVKHRLGATITAHHLLLTRNDLLASGLIPHYYCRPILQRQHDRQILLAAATSGVGPFFLGTDSAPHPVSSKQASPAAAGIFTAPVALELYAEAFEQAGALDKLEDFACRNGANFYCLPLNEGSIRLQRHPTRIPARLPLNGGDALLPFRAGGFTSWSIVTNCA